MTYSDWELVPFKGFFPYPDHASEVLRGEAYWDLPDNLSTTGSIIEIIESAGIRYTQWEGWWRKIDPRHPRCWYCGKFVKTGNEWRRYQTNPCNDCSESLHPW